ncbi:MAG: polysaccharide biosynthesis tyrosine autokinase [Candidatus Eremiobacteraeota bacterium]|nr:polysaccharide biosynthesis tyrosine autokinase [Candidatus Eremiobacteraeota bacterium]
MYELNSGHHLPSQQLPPTHMALSDSMKDAEINAIIRTLMRRWKAALAIFGGFLLLVFLLTVLSPKTYTTQVKLIAGNASGGVGAAAAGADSTLPVLNALLIASGVQSAETYAELFQETPVAQQVISDLKLNTSVYGLLKKISVKPVTNTSILALTATWSDPRTSARIANDFASAIVLRQRDLVASQATTALSFLSKQLPIAQNNMHRTRAALTAFQSTHKFADITSQTQNAITAVANVETKIGQAQVDRQQADAQLASIDAQKSRISATIRGTESVAPNPVLAGLQNQLSQVTVQLETARRQYTEEHPTVIGLKNQQDQIRRAMASQPQTVVSGTSTIPNPVYQQLEQQAAQFRAQSQAASAQLSELQAQHGQLAPALEQLPGQTARFADLQRASKSAEDIYNALQQKYNSAAIAKTTALSDVTITQPALASTAIVKPDLLLNLLLGAVLGLLIAVVSALILDFFDNRVKDEHNAESELALPTLATIPLVKMRDGVPALPWVRALTVESFLQLVTSIRYSSDYPVRSLSITSPTQGDGKSTVALNMAIAMAEIEPLVLLIDADLRRPSLHAKLRMKNDRGLSDILVGTKKLEDVVQRTKYPGLDIVASGTSAPNPLKLLQSNRMDDLITLALEKYRCVIFDGAACNATFDSAVVSRKVDGTVMVVSAGLTDLRFAKRSLRRLEQVGVKNILGFVLNRVEPKQRDYSGYYLEPSKSNAAEEPMITA